MTEHIADSIYKDVEKLKSGHYHDLVGRITRLEIWSQKAETEMKSLKESLDRLENGTRTTHERLSSLEKMGYRMLGGLGVLLVLLSILPHIASVLELI